MKVYSTIHYRELNGYVDVLADIADICVKKVEEMVTALTLENHTYKCVYVYMSHCGYFKKFIFNYIYIICFTWLGFGLTVAVLIMKSVLCCHKINPFEWQHQLTATIYFYCFKLISKDPVWLEDGTQVSGFQESKVMKIPCYKNRRNLWDIFQGVDVCVATAKCWDDEIWYQKSLSQWNKMNLLKKMDVLMKNKILGSIQDPW